MDAHSLPSPRPPGCELAAHSLMKSRFREQENLGLADVRRRRSQPDPVSSRQFQRMRDAQHIISRELSSSANRAEVGEFGAVEMTRFILRENQFTVVGAHVTRALNQVYRRFVEDCYDILTTDLQRRAVDGAIARHHTRLRECLTAELHLNAVSAEKRCLKPFCNNYSPRLQCRILGIDPDETRTPVIDLGCGTEAALVAYLRSEGCHDCLGVDLVCMESKHMVRADWFEVPLRPASWGTVIAHHSFTLHFLNAHLDHSKDAARFARRYVDILRALKPGGSFVYAPDLPFIEDLLDPRQWRVETRPITMQFSGEIGSCASLCETFSATRVTRLLSPSDNGKYSFSRR